MRLLPAFLLLACIPAPPDLCARGVTLQCQRQFECQSDAVKMSAGFQGGWGVDVMDCVMKVSAQADCQDKTTDDQLCLVAGQHFDLTQAAQCESDVKAQSCADFLDPSKVPASCNMRCH
jgi:hypothetical protein